MHQTVEIPFAIKSVMNYRLLFGIITALTVLSACTTGAQLAPTPDANAIFTAAAQTVMAELTLTASKAPPTPKTTFTATGIAPTTTGTIPSVVVTPTLGTPEGTVVCDNFSYDLASLDVNIPDGAQMAPGQDFTKTWKIRNTGSCTWGSGYKVVYGYGPKMDGQPIALSTAVAPGEEVEVSVQFKAPTDLGEYISYWRMANSAGSPFGEFFYVKIMVK
jgi:hypothetical protein